MEPASVVPIDYDSDASDENQISEENEIELKIYDSIRELKEGIYTFKKQLFYSIVSNDSKHAAKDLGAMYSFHALFLQCIAYWIGMLDNTSVPKPKFPNQSQLKEFNALQSAIQTVANYSMDSKVLVYNLLFQFSTAHPFDLGEQKKED